MARVLAAVIGIVVWRTIHTPTGWAVLLTLAGMMVTILVRSSGILYVTALAASGLILVWTHRVELRQGPHLRARANRQWGGARG